MHNFLRGIKFSSYKHFFFFFGKANANKTAIVANEYHCKAEKGNAGHSTGNNTNHITIIHFQYYSGKAKG